FFIFPFSRHLSCERENKGKIRFTGPDSRKSVSTNAAYFLKAGCKGKNFISYLPNVFGSFFHSAFQRGDSRKKQAPSRRNR
ncbi:hypothetical protein PQG91_01305, partial [Bacteroides stercoris]|uniref:hypothetical protein n=1 Tax=Bacteroides stercoris TaxID=46506 RepID=UPI002A60BB20|nr:hypothetical protein [Bacteroides stercoris]